MLPVWNKSNREHSFVGSVPQSVFDAAKIAIDEMGWETPWYVDADHIQLQTVDAYLTCSDFFTIDVADSIGKEADAATLDAFMERHPELVGTLAIEGIDEPMVISADDVRSVASKYLLAVKEAGEIYRHIAAAKGEKGFIPEVSMDETDAPQTLPSYW